MHVIYARACNYCSRRQTVPRNRNIFSWLKSSNNIIADNINQSSEQKYIRRHTKLCNFFVVIVSHLEAWKKDNGWKSPHTKAPFYVTDAYVLAKTREEAIALKSHEGVPQCTQQSSSTQKEADMYTYTENVSYVRRI